MNQTWLKRKYHCASFNPLYRNQKELPYHFSINLQTKYALVNKVDFSRFLMIPVWIVRRPFVSGTFCGISPQKSYCFHQLRDTNLLFQHEQELWLIITKLISLFDNKNLSLNRTRIMINYNKWINLIFKNGLTLL